MTDPEHARAVEHFTRRLIAAAKTQATDDEVGNLLLVMYAGRLIEAMAVTIDSGEVDHQTASTIAAVLLEEALHATRYYRRTLELAHLEATFRMPSPETPQT